jgi:cytochrome c-type biogenesis protein CcmH
VLVRERLKAGDTDDEVRRYLVDRYGEFVLLQPVIAWHTLLLWAAAPVVLLAGVVVIALGVRRRRRAAVPALGEAALTDAEKTALEELGEDSRQK